MSGFLCSMVGASFVTAVAEVIRAKKGIVAVGNAQIDTAQSKFGGASALFDGTGDYLSIPVNSSTEPLADLMNNDFTIEFWMYNPETGIDGTYGDSVMGIENGGSGSNGWLIRNYGSKLQWVFDGQGGYDVATFNPSANTWHHIAFVRSGTTLKCYTDGTERTVTSYVDRRTNSGTYSIRIGKVYNSLNDDYTGHLDEIRISKVARYTTTFTPSTTAFVNDANTVLLIHANGTDASTFFEDDNGSRASIGITAVNQAQISTAQSKFGGSSIVFDGTDDHLTVATFPTTTGDFTWELWGRFDILPWNQTIGGGSFMQVAYSSGSDYLIISRSGSSGSQVMLQVATGGRYGSFTKSGVNLAINTWYHIAFVRTSGVWKAFFNGTELTTFINDSNFTNSGRTENIAYPQIGKFGDSRGSWDGYMDEIRFSNSARYTADFTPSTTPFVNDANTLLLIHADGTDASTVFRDDNGARAQQGVQAIGNAQVDTAQSKFGGASALFDGTGDYLSLAHESSLSLADYSNWTIECWIRFTDGTARTVLNKDGQAGSFYPGYTFFTNGSKQIIFGVGGSAGNWITITRSTALSDATWYHLAAVKNGSTVTFYVDGVSAGTATFVAYNDRGQALNIGYETNGTYMYGHIDEIRISNTARYTAGFTPSTTPFQNDANTVLLMHMDGTDASTVFTDDNGVTPTHSYT